MPTCSSKHLTSLFCTRSLAFGGLGRGLEDGPSRYPSATPGDSGPSSNDLWKRQTQRWSNFARHNLCVDNRLVRIRAMDVVVTDNSKGSIDLQTHSCRALTTPLACTNGRTESTVRPRAAGKRGAWLYFFVCSFGVAY